ncbi:integrase [Natronolimnohabitans innermongolicus JCM 12255]|uniref:Integrase n=1 Tax=Natronolimnohabitans innermongolicus JCM 12255 TaxID=1227499 RepID=L9WL03_9EURY|nr:integrase [Natronolimnohabitans innermongolicus JCM 12255]
MMFFVGSYFHLASFAQFGLSGQLDCADRDLIEYWFHTLKMCVDRFHNSWMDRRASVRTDFELYLQFYSAYRTD